MSSVLLTGACGGVAQIVIEKIKDQHTLVGIDPRKPKTEFSFEFHPINYSNRKVEDLFREHNFDVLIHMGRVRADSGVHRNERYNLNVLGTRNLLNLAKKYNVKKVIVFSTFHVYGAHQHNHLHITEDEPLRAIQTFPALSDAVELDHFAKTFSLQYPEVQTLILRPVNIIGSRVHNTISTLFRQKLCPVLLGYDPMMQFIHEEDMANALISCLRSEKSGVYNVAGEGMIPYTHAVSLAGTIPAPIPHLAAKAALQIFGKGIKFPKHLMDYFRYPVIISDDAFKRDFDFKPSMTTLEAFESLRRSLHEF